MTNETTIAAVAGILLSLLFSYVPGARDWFDGLEGTHKRLVMLGLLAVASIGIFTLGCAGIVEGLPCTQDGAVGVLKLFIAAMVTNQATYSFAPKPQEFVIEGEFDFEAANAKAVDTDFQP